MSDRYMMREYRSREYNKLRDKYENMWNEKVWDKHIMQEQKFLERIEGKQNEIMGLRDGVGPVHTYLQYGNKVSPILITKAKQLFNATTHKEGSKSATFSRYVIIFTIVTVVYLPPGFSAVFHLS